MCKNLFLPCIVYSWSGELSGVLGRIDNQQWGYFWKYNRSRLKFLQKLFQKNFCKTSNFFGRIFIILSEL